MNLYTFCDVIHLNDENPLLPRGKSRCGKNLFLRMGTGEDHDCGALYEEITVQPHKRKVFLGEPILSRQVFFNEDGLVGARLTKESLMIENVCDVTTEEPDDVHGMKGTKITFHCDSGECFPVYLLEEWEDGQEVGGMPLYEFKELQEKKRWKRFVFMSENQAFGDGLNPLMLEMTFSKMTVIPYFPLSVVFQTDGPNKQTMMVRYAKSVTCDCGASVIGDIIKIHTNNGDERKSYVFVAQDW